MLGKRCPGGGMFSLPSENYVERALLPARRWQLKTSRQECPLQMTSLTAIWDRTIGQLLLLSPTFRTARKASWGISTRPMRFMRFFPSFCFSRSLRLRLMSPP